MKRNGYYVTNLGAPHYGHDSGDIGGVFKHKDAARTFAREHVKAAPLGIYRVHSRRSRRDQVEVVYPQEAKPFVHQAAKKSPAQLEHEIAEALGRHHRSFA